MAIVAMQLNLNELYPPKKYKFEENDLRWLNLLFEDHLAARDIALSLASKMESERKNIMERYLTGEQKIIGILFNI